MPTQYRDLYRFGSACIITKKITTLPCPVSPRRSRCITRCLTCCEDTPLLDSSIRCGRLPAPAPLRCDIRTHKGLHHIIGSHHILSLSYVCLFVCHYQPCRCHCLCPFYYNVLCYACHHHVICYVYISLSFATVAFMYTQTPCTQTYLHNLHK